MSNRFLHYVGKPVGLALAGLLLVSCGGGGGGSSSDGGFTGTSDTLDIEFNTDKLRMPANVSFDGPNRQGPFVSNFTVRVFDENGRLFPAESIAVSMDPVRVGSLFYLDGDPEHEDENGNPLAFRRMIFEETDGIATGHFLAGSGTGTVRLTASVVDPVSNSAQTAELFIEVFDDVSRVPTSLRFTGAYVNAVLAGASGFGSAESSISSGTYQRIVSAIATTIDGTPARPSTQIDFFLIDSPVIGFPADGAGSFVIAGSDGDPLELGEFFSANSGQFLSNGVLPRDRLVLDGTFTNQPNNRDLTGIYSVQSVAAENQLLITGTPSFPSNDAGDTGASVPYIVGRADHSTVLTRALTDFTGVATTIVTYPQDSVGRTAVLVACTTDRSVCTTLNRCDANGANCGSVFLPVSNGTDIQLTSSATELGPNTTTPVQFCLQDVNFVPLQATPISYDIPGGTGSAVVTINGDGALAGSVLTGADGCATVTVASTGQAPGTDPILVLFSADGVDPTSPVTLTIAGPGAGKLTGSTTCEGIGDLFVAQSCSAVTPIASTNTDGTPGNFIGIPAQCADFFDTATGEFSLGNFDVTGTAACTTTLFLADDRGGPIPRITITSEIGDGSAISGLTFDPPQGDGRGVTDENGENSVTADYSFGADSSITFAAGGAEFTVSVPLTLPGS